MDETYKKIIALTAKETGVDKKVVEDIIKFQNNKLEQLIRDYDKHDISEVKIPYICRFQFKPEHYEKFMEKVKRKKDSQNQCKS